MGSPCLPSLSQTKPYQLSSVQLRRSVRALRAVDALCHSSYQPAGAVTVTRCRLLSSRRDGHPVPLLSDSVIDHLPSLVHFPAVLADRRTHHASI